MAYLPQMSHERNVYSPPARSTCLGISCNVQSVLMYTLLGEVLTQVKYMHGIISAKIDIYIVHGIDIYIVHGIEM